MSNDQNIPNAPLNRPEERLSAEAKALRDNLAKRKAQTRARRKPAPQQTDTSESEA